QEPQNEDAPTHRSPLYDERVGAPVFLWVLVALLAGSLGVAYGAAVGWRWGAVMLLVVGGLGTWWLLAARALITVDGGPFVAGRARLPVRFVGEVEALDADGARYVAGPGADARAYLLLRGTGRGAVKVELVDPADPTPYWLVSTRDPV